LKTNLTKRRIALIQMERSLKLVEAGDPVSALTLAGAAEEILGRFASRRKVPPCVELTAEGLASLYHQKHRRCPPKKHLIGFLNSARNHLKHQDDGRNIRVDADWQSEAETMLFRAMINHFNSFDCYPSSQPLRRWMTGIMPRHVP
jgi:hypothetical protein